MPGLNGFEKREDLRGEHGKIGHFVEGLDACHQCNQPVTGVEV